MFVQEGMTYQDVLFIDNPSVQDVVNAVHNNEAIILYEEGEPTERKLRVALRKRGLHQLSDEAKSHLVVLFSNNRGHIYEFLQFIKAPCPELN